MKILLLTLVLALGCVDAAITDVSKLSGNWVSVYTASTNPREQGPIGELETYTRVIEFDEAKGTATFKFFVKQNGECVRRIVTAQQLVSTYYTASYAGTNMFHVRYTSEDAMVLYFLHMDSHHQEPLFTVVLHGKDGYVSKQDMAEFKKLVKEMTVPLENVVNLIPRDDCPKNF